MSPFWAFFSLVIEENKEAKYTLCCSKYVYGREWRTQKVLKGGREERGKEGGEVRELEWEKGLGEERRYNRCAERNLTLFFT